GWHCGLSARAPVPCVAKSRRRTHAEGLYRRRVGRLGQRAGRPAGGAGDRHLRDLPCDLARRCLGLRRSLYLGAGRADPAAERLVRPAGRAARLMRRFWLVLLILPPVLALTVLPAFGQRLVTLVGIYALLGLGYQSVFGQLGALNLAQGALFGVGA